MSENSRSMPKAIGLNSLASEKKPQNIPKGKTLNRRGGRNSKSRGSDDLGSTGTLESSTDSEASTPPLPQPVITWVEEVHNQTGAELLPAEILTVEDTVDVVDFLAPDEIPFSFEEDIPPLAKEDDDDFVFTLVDAKAEEPPEDSSSGAAATNNDEPVAPDWEIDAVSDLSNDLEKADWEIDLDSLGSEMPPDESLDLPTESKSWVNWTESHQPFYYGSGHNLIPGRVVRPLFQVPVEFLANSKKTIWDDRKRSIKGHGRHFNFSFPRDDRLNRLEQMALDSDRLRYEICRLANEVDYDRYKKPVKAFLARIRVLEFMRTIWDALLLSFQQIKLFDVHWNAHCHPPSWFIRTFDRWKRKIISNPYLAAKELKTIGGVARSIYFDDHSVSRPALLYGLSKESLRLFSYIGRALPPPPAARRVELQAYKDRVTSVPPPVNHEWGPFLESYFQEYFPRSPVNYRTDPSVAASLGYSRQSGGFTKAVQDLVSLGCLIHTMAHRSKFENLSNPLTPEGKAQIQEMADLYKLHCFDLDPKPNVREGYNPSSLFYETVENKAKATSNRPGPNQTTLFPKDRNRCEDEWRSRASLESMLSLVESESIHSFYLNVAVRVVLGTVANIPLLAIYAEEKGLKARLPATTLAAASLVYQMLRRAIDSHLFQDARFAKPMGGSLPLPTGRSMKNSAGRFYYSQDLSFATDLHPFWLERTAYEKLLPHHPKLKWTERFFDKLFGPHSVLTDPDKVPPPPDDIFKVTTPWWDYNQSTCPPTGRAYWTDTCTNFGSDGPLESAILKDGRRMHELRNATVAKWKFQGNRVLLASVEQSYTFVQDYLAWLRDLSSISECLTSTSASMGDATSFPIMPLLTAFAGHQAGLPNLWGAGDDAVISNADDQSIKTFEEVMTSCGAVLSRGDPKKGKPNKIFQHPTKFNFCEEMYDRLQVKKFYHTSLWSAPPGGSKGHIDWFNQPSSVIEHQERLGIRGRRALWPFTKTAQHQKAAYSLGLPIGQPVEFGGINHPSFPTNQRSIKDPDYRSAWLDKLSQVDSIGWATGTGLSPLPSGESQASRTATSEYLRRLKSYRFASDGRPVYTADPTVRSLTIDEVGSLVSNMVTSWEIYHRHPPGEITAPRLDTASRRFVRKIYNTKVKGVAKSMAATMADIARKRSVGVDSSLKLLNEESLAVRAYGLLPYVVPKVEKAKFQWERKAKWRVADAYLVPQERA
nr:MAG: RNA-dependent RNA polymerase [Moss associated narna-like virus 3]